ncbi:MAG: cell division protein SepF [Synechococcaceae cyanobacterium]
MASLRPDGRQPSPWDANRAVIPLLPAEGRHFEVVAPYRFEQAADVIASVRAGRTVLLQVDHLEPETGQRLIDFVCGGMAALDGQSQRLEDWVFLFAPATVVSSAL